MMKFNFFVSVLLALAFVPADQAVASVESSLMAVQSKLINTIFPLVGILGLVFAGMSFFMGHENARSRVVLAVIGAIVGFAAPSIMDLIRSLVH